MTLVNQIHLTRSLGTLDGRETEREYTFLQFNHFQIIACKTLKARKMRSTKQIWFKKSFLAKTEKKTGRSTQNRFFITLDMAGNPPLEVDNVLFIININK